MIRFLGIENLAIVDRLEVELSAGLSVLTGETGAGKSILVGALDLLAGARGSGDLVRTGADRARVQATVETAAGEEVLLRRDITTQGRSRAFVDGALVSVHALQQRSAELMDLHGQHEHQALLDPTRHLAFLDAFSARACPGDEAAETARAFDAWTAAHRRLAQCRERGRDLAARKDRLTVEQEEILSVDPTPGEDEDLAAQRLKLVNVERLAALTDRAYSTLYERDDSVMTGLGTIWRQIEELTQLDGSFAPYLESRGEIESRLEDLAFFLRSYAADLDAAPTDLERVENRLNNLEKLKRKYGPSLDDVLQHAALVSKDLDSLELTGEEERDLAKQEQVAREAYLTGARALTAKRHDAAGLLESRLQTLLSEIAIPSARFEVRFAEPSGEESRWRASGVDDAEFQFSANPGESVRPLARVASGGELSRLMLGLKTLATTDEAGKTLVFDEIDAGIGGAAADRVGALLARLARTYQIVCVTHLPQIAAYATVHYRVAKRVDDRDRTVVEVDELSMDERIGELSRLMTGTDSPSSRAGAKELLMSKQMPKGESESRRRKVKTRG